MHTGLIMDEPQINYRKNKIVLFITRNKNFNELKSTIKQNSIKKAYNGTSENTLKKIK